MTRRAPHFALRTLLAVTLLAIGCQPGAPLEGAPDFDSRGDAFRIGNGIGTDALVLNAVTTNRTALALLVGSPLSAELVDDPYFSHQLQDPAARAMLGYIVSCALGPTQGLRTPWGTLRGEAGLCSEWENSPPDQACQERVSACLLARNNALGHQVPISIRGEDTSNPELFALDAAVPTYTLELPTALPHPVFGACPNGTVGHGRNCGWRPENTGRCIPGATVQLGAGGVPPNVCPAGQALGAAGAVRPVLRVCEGIGGCDAGQALAGSEGSCAHPAPAVSFVCPASGLFSVLSGGYDAALQAHPAVGVNANDPLAYPASEAEVFSIREGAFFGNLFDADKLHPDADVYVDEDGKVRGKEVLIPGALYRDMWSCRAPGWSDPEAFDTSRLCALPGYNCAATSLGECWNGGKAGNRCASEDGDMVQGDGDFERCKDDNGRTWERPITTFVTDIRTGGER